MFVIMNVADTVEVSRLLGSFFLFFPYFFFQIIFFFIWDYIGIGCTKRQVSSYCRQQGSGHCLAQGQDAAPYPRGVGQREGGQGALTLLGARHSRHHKQSWQWAGALQRIHSGDSVYLMCRSDRWNRNIIAGEDMAKETRHKSLWLILAATPALLHPTQEAGQHGWSEDWLEWIILIIQVLAASSITGSQLNDVALTDNWYVIKISSASYSIQSIPVRRKTRREDNPVTQFFGILWWYQL